MTTARPSRARGLHFALNRLVARLSRFYRERHSNKGYALLIDFAKFFDSIDHGILFGLPDRDTEREDTGSA